MLDSVQPVLEAIEKGDAQRARQLLRPLLQNPTADVWYAASFVYEQPEHRITCLQRALKLDPLHGDARRRLKQLRQGRDLPLVSSPQMDLLPPIELLVENVPKAPPPAPKSIWNVRNRRRRRNWALVGVAGSALLSLSAAYFVMTVLGSPIPAQIRSLLTGSQPSNAAEGTPVFGQPSNSNFPTPASGGKTQIEDISVEGQNSSNVVLVRANQSKSLQWEKPLSDVLDDGYAHEYTFTPMMGDEVAIGIQFFSPTAQNVGPNVAVLDSMDANAEESCERDAIFQDNTGIALICQINQPGLWKVQILGRQGESTGVYVITIDRF
jgi:hypothetical protein